MLYLEKKHVMNVAAAAILWQDGSFKVPCEENPTVPQVLMRLEWITEAATLNAGCIIDNWKL